MREGRIDGVVDRLITFLEFAVDVDLLAELVDYVEVVVGIAQNDRFARIERKDVAVHIDEKNFAGFVE